MTTREKYKGKRFTCAPLVEAVVEIRFDINLAIDCKKDQFFEKVRNDFPIVQLPAPAPFEPSLIQPIAFHSSDRRKNLQTGATKFAFITRNYSDYSSFKKESAPLLHDFINTYAIQNISRLGLRYVNHIPIKKAGRVVDYQNILNIKIQLPQSIHLEKLNDFQTVFICDSDDGARIRTLIGTGMINQTNVIVLDNDVSFQGKIKAGHLDELMDKAHDEIENVFLDLLTDNYLDSIGCVHEK